MKIFAINGSPRKTQNTAKLLENFLEGAASVSEKIETEKIDIYDFDYKGCRGCGACKLKGGKFYGKCAQRDGITELLDRMADADIIVFGSPIYYSGITGELRSFLERFLYPFTSFQKTKRTIAPKNIRTAFIYAMNVTEENSEKLGYRSLLSPLEGTVKRTFGYEPEILSAYFTYQYSDYDKYVADLWDANAKAEWREKQFPIDCKNAFELGKKMALSVKSEQI